MNGRADGFSVLEALAALTLTALLATALVSTAVAEMRLARALSARAASLDAVRTASWVLAGELRRSHVRDVRAYSRDSLALRAFRGRGIPCAPAADAFVVRYRGDRLPNPDKDSLLVMGAWGETTAPLDAVHDVTACAPGTGERILRLETRHDGGTPAVVLVFESGTYYLSSRALRYRTGAEGRQPITAEALGRSGFAQLDSSSLRFTLIADDLRPETRSAFYPPPPHD